MKLEGKTKEEFDKWYLKNNTHSRWVNFDVAGDSMQWGVYQDFFDSVGIYISVIHNEVARKYHYDISTKPMSNDITTLSKYTRQQARTAAIKAAMEIHNKTK